MRKPLLIALLAITLATNIAQAVDRDSIALGPINPADLKDAYYDFSLNELEFAGVALLSVISAGCLAHYEIPIAGTPGRTAEVTSLLWETTGAVLDRQRRADIYDKIFVQIRSRFQDPSYDSVMRKTCKDAVRDMKSAWPKSDAK